VTPAGVLFEAHNKKLKILQDRTKEILYGSSEGYELRVVDAAVKGDCEYA